MGDAFLVQNIKQGPSAPDGSSPEKAALSAEAILEFYPDSPNGIYWIDLPVVGPTEIYCLMESKYDGGGWMLAMKATRGTTFQYSSTHWTTTSTLNPTALNLNDSDAKYNVMNYFEGRDLFARWPDITVQGGSLSVDGMWTWLEKNYPPRIGQQTSTMINLFNTADRTFIQDAKTFSGWASGRFSSQIDVRFYGFNYRSLRTSGQQSQTRWGFGWNENGGGLFPNGIETSPDVTGGIGMIHAAGVGTFSAGDYISCCADTTGINRSARVEVYVR
jgi:hypothetical protein